MDILFPDLTAESKAVRDLSDAIFECVSNIVDSLIDVDDADPEAIDELVDRLYRLATTGK